MNPRTAQPELVEGLSFFMPSARKGGRSFDKLRTSGFGCLCIFLAAAAEPPAPGYQPGYSIPAPPAPANGA